MEVTDFPTNFLEGYFWKPVTLYIYLKINRNSSMFFDYVKLN